MEFCDFDESYVERLRSGDFRTQEHFVAYFSELVRVKLRSRVRFPEAVEDLKQETFARVLTALRSDAGLRHPEKLGVFVNSTCNNVLLEYYRSASRSSRTEDEAILTEQPDARADTLSLVMAAQLREHIGQILAELPERDRRVLHEVLLEERDKDEICAEMGVDREYLRVLVHRAKQAFKAKYLQRTGRPVQR